MQSVSALVSYCTSASFVNIHDNSEMLMMMLFSTSYARKFGYHFRFRGLFMPLAPGVWKVLFVELAIKGWSWIFIQASGTKSVHWKDLFLF